MARIEFVVRSDAFEKPGGDSIQIAEYGRLLVQRGHDVTLRPFDPGMKFERDVLVHLVNIDRVYDFICARRAAKKNLVFCSPIHHDLMLIRNMREVNSHPTAIRRAADMLPESVREYLAFVARYVVGRSFTLLGVLRLLLSATWILNPWRKAGEVLDGMERVFVLAEGERSSLMRDSGWSGRNYSMTPNGVRAQRSENSLNEWSARSESILVIGRIEPRKRSLELAVAAADRGIPVRFVGAAGSSEKYAQQFGRVVDRFDCLEWLGPVSHEGAIAWMASSKVLLNASLVEVQSLVDIEASLMGCWVVSTPAGYSTEHSDVIVETDGFDVSDVLSVADGLRRSPSAPRGSSYSYSWESSVDVILACYSDSLGTV